MSLYSDISQTQLNTADLLKCNPLFAGLDAGQLAEIGARLRQRNFAPGVTLFHQDMPGSYVYLIEKGRLRVFILGRTGIEITLNVIGPGDILGELAFLDNKPHSATALTLEYCVVWLLARSDMEELLERYPVIAQSLLRILSNRVRGSTHLIEALAFQDVQGRLAYRLLFLAEHHGSQTPEGIEIAVPLTQGELATMVGATRESVNKALTVLRTSDLIRIEGARLTVINTQGLQKMIFDRGR
jgi:CRP-like cAMP-binding protein